MRGLGYMVRSEAVLLGQGFLLRFKNNHRESNHSETNANRDREGSRDSNQGAAQRTRAEAELTQVLPVE